MACFLFLVRLAAPFLSDHCRPFVLKNVLAPEHLTVRASSGSKEYVEYVCECERRRESHTSDALGRNRNQYSQMPSQAPSDVSSGNHLRGCLEGHTWPSPNRRNRADCQSARCGRRPLRARSRSGARKISSSRSGPQIRARGRPRWPGAQQPCVASPSNRVHLQSGWGGGHQGRTQPDRARVIRGRQGRTQPDQARAIRFIQSHSP